MQVRGLKDTKSQPKIPYIGVKKLQAKRYWLKKDVQSKLAIKACAGMPLIILKGLMIGAPLKLLAVD